MGIHQPLLPADCEELARTYLTPRSQWPVVTKTPKPLPNKSVPPDHLRVEFGGGRQVNLLEYDLDIILYGCALEEPVASLICRRNFAYLCAASGSRIPDVTGDPELKDWHVGWARSASLPHMSKSTDPQLPIPRYRAMATWRVQGQPIEPITP